MIARTVGEVAPALGEMVKYVTIGTLAGFLLLSPWIVLLLKWTEVLKGWSLTGYPPGVPSGPRRYEGRGPGTGPPPSVPRRPWP